MEVVRIPYAPRVVKGRGLAARKLSKPGRALLAADVVEGATVLTDLSRKQIAAAVGVSTRYLNAAMRLTAQEREAVRRGLRPLVERVPAVQSTTARDRLLAIATEIGVDETLSLLASVEPRAA